jgi:hypothetical protein
MAEPTLAIADARYGELLRLQFMLDDPNFTLERLREYIQERTEEVYPQEYHIYRRRWAQLAEGNALGSASWPKLEYLEWRSAVDTLAEELRLSDLLGEAETARAQELRAMLMLGSDWQDDYLPDNR